MGMGNKMRPDSLVDDVILELWSGGDGPPILFTNQNIRRMLRLVRATKEDVFCDLGSGFAQNLIIAASEFGVRQCIGVEENKARYEMAQERIEKLEDHKRIAHDQVKIVNSRYEKVIKGKVRGINLKNATIIFFGLRDPKILDLFSSHLLPATGCRFVYYDLCLYPEIMPSGSDYPFYYSLSPFKWTKDQKNPELDWLRALVRKKNRKQSQQEQIQELWDELTHDHNVQNFSIEELAEHFDNYKKRLDNVVRRGFQK